MLAWEFGCAKATSWMPQEPPRVRRTSLLLRMFSRASKLRLPAGQPPDTAGEEHRGSNIVILNSLTHDQLLHLFRVATVCARDLRVCLLGLVHTVSACTVRVQVHAAEDDRQNGMLVY